jgi:hypothetical protein
MGLATLFIIDRDGTMIGPVSHANHDRLQSLIWYPVEKAELVPCPAIAAQTPTPDLVSIVVMFNSRWRVSLRWNLEMIRSKFDVANKPMAISCSGMCTVGIIACLLVISVRVPALSNTKLEALLGTLQGAAVGLLFAIAALRSTLFTWRVVRDVCRALHRQETDASTKASSENRDADNFFSSASTSGSGSWPRGTARKLPSLPLRAESPKGDPSVSTGTTDLLWDRELDG